MLNHEWNASNRRDEMDINLISIQIPADTLKKNLRNSSDIFVLGCIVASFLILSFKNLSSPLTRFYLFHADPDWASYTLGVFLCLHCSRIHCNIPRISKVKSLRTDHWDEDEVQVSVSLWKAFCLSICVGQAACIQSSPTSLCWQYRK